MEKVKVSREVANAMKELESWIGGDKDRVDKVLKVAELLAYGYEVEQTPEEKVAELYRFNKYSTGEVSSARANTIEFVLNTLGIQIKGVND